MNSSNPLFGFRIYTGTGFGTSGVTGPGNPWFSAGGYAFAPSTTGKMESDGNHHRPSVKLSIFFFDLVFTFLTTNSDSVRGYATQNLVGGIAFNAPNKFDLAVIWTNFADGVLHHAVHLQAH